MQIEFFYDVLETVSNQPILVEADIFLLPPEQGGRSTPITSSYRPNHNFGDSENRIFYIGQVELKEGESHFPGETKTFLVTFLDSKGLREKLKIGREWKIQTGSHVFGTAIVRHIIDKT